MSKANLLSGPVRAFADPTAMAAAPAPTPLVATEVVTHEEYLHAIRAVVVARINDDATRARVVGAKLLYGIGVRGGTRGGTFFKAWQNGTDHEVIEVAARGEESVLQLAGTTIHEIAHVIAGMAGGHGPTWKEACAGLGLARAEAAGQTYLVGDFDPALWSVLSGLAVPTDGDPMFRRAPVDGSIPTRVRACPIGYGTRGGRSRGAGSGSRLILVACPGQVSTGEEPDSTRPCEYKVRITRRWLDAIGYGAPKCPKHALTLREREE